MHNFFLSKLDGNKSLTILRFLWAQRKKKLFNAKHRTKIHFTYLLEKCFTISRERTHTHTGLHTLYDFYCCCLLLPCCQYLFILNRSHEHSSACLLHEQRTQNERPITNSRNICIASE